LIDAMQKSMTDRGRARGSKLTTPSNAIRIRLLLAALIVALASIVAIDAVLRHNDAGSVSALDRKIDSKIAKLGLPPRHIELTFETALRMRRAIKNGQYQAASQIEQATVADSHLQNWRYYPFTGFIQDAVDVDDAALENNLTKWIKSDEKSKAIPLLFRAEYYYKTGWLRRGNAFVEDTAAERLSAFSDYMKKALNDVEAAIRLDDSNPFSFYLRLQILQGYGISTTMTDIFTQSISRFPGYYELYTMFLRTLEPRWGGNLGLMYAFVDKYAGAAAANSPLKLLYVNLYGELLTTASIECQQFRHDPPIQRQCVQAAMGRFVTPSLENEVVAALQLYDRSDRYEFGLAINSVINEMLQTTEGDVYSGALLQLTASSMHSDTQLREDQPGHNNYVIDRLVAVSWYEKQFYENSLKKFVAALTDVKNFKFPTEEDRDLALSMILDDIAGTDNKRGDYLSMIAYEKAAVALGGKPTGEPLICFGYYKLQHYEEAVHACELTINKTGDLQAHYWRGLSYRSLGDQQAALRDLHIVAGSGSSYRSYAAIDMSMLYFNRNDNKAALTVLNQYTYLYNPNVTASEDVAVAYNNRCYAYMQLGQLKAALADCTNSLRYGSLPDAFRKQQELVARLKAK
jgi:tetratricopeptide (TPR) repeat protein